MKLRHACFAAAVCLLAAGVVRAQTWTEPTPSMKPPRWGAAMAFDVRNGKAVLFGGAWLTSGVERHQFNDTFLWDGTEWTDATPSLSPSARDHHAMAYDEARGEVVLFGGNDVNTGALGDTWVWNGSVWSLRSPASSPSTRFNHAMVYDPVRRVVLLFGGTSGGTSANGDTWAWDGTNWRVVTTAGPPGRHGHGMAWDAARQAVLIYGGTTYSGSWSNATDTWLWNGTAWSDRSSSPNPGEAVFPSMVSHSGRILLFGGDNGTSRSRQTWTWNGTGWKQMVSVVSPPGNSNMAAAYDPLRDRTLIFGGSSDGVASDRLWSFELGGGCTFSDAAPGAIPIPHTGGAGEVSVQVAPGCHWTASSTQSWLSLTTSSGTGPGPMRFLAEGNPTALTREAWMHVSGRDYRVVQAQLPCPSGALPRSVAVPNYCSSTFTYLAAPGDSIAVWVYGKPPTLTDRICAYCSSASVRLNGPAPANTLIATGTTYDGAGIRLTKLPDSGFVTFPSPGTYNITISAGGGPYGQTGVLTVANRQDCVVQAWYDVPFRGILLDNAPLMGGESRHIVSLPPGCSAAAVSTGAPWVTSSVASVGPGFTGVTFSIGPNYGPERLTIISIGSTSLPVRQLANPCSYSLARSAATVGAAPSTGSVELITNPAGNCPWNATSNAAWVQPYPLSSYRAEPVQYTVFPNFGTKTRTATLQIATQTFTITQTPASGTPSQRFVQLVYFAYFGRMPSEAEMNFQTGSGQSRQQLALNFLNSQEFNIGGRYVAGLYVGLLNRDAEYGGWLFQRNALSTGVVNQDAIVANFLASAEFVAKYGSLDNRAFVTLLYKQILLRDPTSPEVDFQAGALTAGLSRAALAKNFLNSAEFRVGTGPRLTAFLTYATLLQRQPTQVEAAAAAAIAQKAQAINDLPTRQAMIRDQLLAPVANGAEMNAILE